MNRVASVMQLKPGCEAEYKKRHDEIWPELAALLKEAGIGNYSIFLHPHTLQLFAYLESANNDARVNLSAQEIMQRWWAYMKDIMETNADNSPVAIPLNEVFYLP
ncbi:MAG: L-rhamnose mutarotase [Edaphocola sp.]